MNRIVLLSLLIQVISTAGNSESCYFPAICKEHSIWIKLTDCVCSACETELNGIQEAHLQRLDDLELQLGKLRKIFETKMAEKTIMTSTTIEANTATVSATTIIPSELASTAEETTIQSTDATTTMTFKPASTAAATTATTAEATTIQSTDNITTMNGNFSCTDGFMYEGRTFCAIVASGTFDSISVWCGAGRPADILNEEQFNITRNYLTPKIPPGVNFYFWLGMTFDPLINVAYLYNGTNATYLPWYNEFPRITETYSHTRIALTVTSTTLRGIRTNRKNAFNNGVLCQFD